MSASRRRDIPRFDRPIIETHCHLDYLPQDELEAVLRRSAETGVDRIVTIAVSPENLATVRDIAARHAAVWCTQGVHPHEAGSYSADAEAAIRAGSVDAKVLAIGEIGLDYYYDHAPRDLQRQVFSAQLALAADLDLPVVIHTRDADEDMAAVLAEHLPDLRRRGVIHSFSSGASLAEFCLDAGFMLGFNGMVTFKGADNVRDIVAMTPIDRLVLETDAPYLTPVPWRGHPNAPFYLPFIAEKIAEVKAMEIATLLDHARLNSERLFDFSAAEVP